MGCRPTTLLQDALAAAQEAIDPDAVPPHAHVAIAEVDGITLPPPEVCTGGHRV